MNVRMELGPFNNGAETGSEKNLISRLPENIDKTTEQELIQEVFNNPEQKPQPVRPKTISPSTSDERMREALARFKAEQAGIYGSSQEIESQKKEAWGEFEQGNQERLEKKAERAEKRSLPSSTSSFAVSARSASPEQMGEALIQKNKDLEQTFASTEKHQLLEKQLLQLQETLHHAEKEGDKELVRLLEEQEKTLVNMVNKYRETAPSPILSETQREVGLKNIATMEADARRKAIEQNTEEVDFIEIPDDHEQPKENIEPGDNTLATLHELGIDFNELISVVPEFATMTEGQRAYILYKSEQQSLEHIQEKADADFKHKVGQSGFFKKLFRSGAMRREANREAANTHVGLPAFQEDIARITKHVGEAGLDISIEETGNYRINYAKAPEGINEEERALFDNYNRAATVLSDVPYEWGLPTASKKEQKAFLEAQKNFKNQEASLMQALEVDGQPHPEIILQSNELRSQIELNQFFSSYPDVSEKIDKMKKDSNWWKRAEEYTKNVFTKKGFSKLKEDLINPTAKTTIVASGAVARLVSKSLWGLGGATGASAIIGGVMAWRKKNTEFKTDAKQARRGGETKKTTDKLFDAKSNADRIYKLLAKLETVQSPESRERTLSALEDRLQILDERLKTGRVNFGKAKEQLGNKSELINALSSAHVYRQSILEDQKSVDQRITGYFDKQDKSSKGARNKERVKASLIGASIGAGFAASAWMIADYFKGGETSAKVLDALRDGMKGAGTFFEETGESIKDGVGGTYDAIKNSFGGGQPWFPHGTGGFVPENPISTIPDGDRLHSPFEYMPGVRMGGEEVVENLKESISNPANFEVSVDASPRGAIDMYKNLQNEIHLKYPDISKAPAHLQEFVSKSATDLAIEDNMYKPNDPSGNESAKIFKGGKLGFTASGERVYTDARNGVNILSGDGKFGGEHFDYKTYSAGSNPQQEILNQNGSTGNSDKLHPGTPWETEKPWLKGVDENGVRGWTEPMNSQAGNENIFAGNGAEGMVNQTPETNLPEGIERVKLSEKFYVDFEIGEDSKGRLESTFHNVKLDNFNAYHKAYLKGDLSSFAREIATSSEFLKENPGMNVSQVEGDLRNLTNQMIMRDQVLQEGGLDPKSDEYKILKRERDAIRKVIKNNFEWYAKSDLVQSFDGNKYPDPNYVFETPSANETAPSANVENKIPEAENTGGGAEQVPETKDTLTGKDTASAKGVEYSIERNENGQIVEMTPIKGTLDLSQVSLDKEFGYDKNWLDRPEFPQTFKDTPGGKQLLSTIQDIKKSVAFRDTFIPNSEEYNYWNKVIKIRIGLVEAKYPAIFDYKN